MLLRGVPAWKKTRPGTRKQIKTLRNHAVTKIRQNGK